MSNNLKTRTENVAFPHGKCACLCKPCKDVPGPAAFEVVRNGQKLLVCTRCYCTDDVDAKLLVNKEDSPFIFFAYDAVGALMIALMLGGNNPEPAEGFDVPETVN